MTANTYYKMKLAPEESGLLIVKQKWISIHETPCFDFCVKEGELWRHHFFTYKRKKTPLQYYKENKLLQRIHKTNSRFAFNTEEKALEHLKLLKRKQLHHMERDTDFIKTFLAADKLEPCGDFLLVPNTKELVLNYLNFDY